MNNSVISLICNVFFLSVRVCAFADGFMLSVRVYTQRTKWNRLLMKALHARRALHMFQNQWVSLSPLKKLVRFTDILSIFLYVLIIFLLISICFLPLLTVVESAIMASIKIKEPG